jgi:hypothetical protein
MKQDEEYMTKTFGKSEISRQLFADMQHPICVKNLTDEQMEELAKNVERDVIQKFPGVAEKMFALWSVGIDVETGKEMDFLESESIPAQDLWWDLLQWYAINKYDAKYCCDIELDEMPQYAKPTKEDMEDAIESNKQSQEQIESAIVDIDMKSAEYKEAADMMEETRRRAEVVELAEKLWLRNLKDLAEYSYYDAFKDAETFIKLKSKYLKEGKLC